MKTTIFEKEKLRATSVHFQDHAPFACNGDLTDSPSSPRLPSTRRIVQHVYHHMRLDADPKPGFQSIVWFHRSKGRDKIETPKILPCERTRAGSALYPISFVAIRILSSLPGVSAFVTFVQFLLPDAPLSGRLC